MDKSGVRSVIDRTLGPRGTLLAFSHGNYLSSTAYDSYFAYCVYFDSSDVGLGLNARDIGYSVRLITEPK